jgi:hypothetical protein
MIAARLSGGVGPTGRNRRPKAGQRATSFLESLDTARREPPPVSKKLKGGEGWLRRGTIEASKSVAFAMVSGSQRLTAMKHFQE